MTAALENFLRGVERRAFRTAEIATGNVDEALDIVQDAMLVLTSRYRDKRAEEWGPLFQCILHSRINDWHRRSRVRNRLFGWLSARQDDEDNDEDPVASVMDPAALDPLITLSQGVAAQVLIESLKTLPLRQQQAFLLRVWEGCDTRQTAAAMQCSEGSVKTHFSRAVATLRKQLEAHWDV
jgi:RNA polymerase sigma-70 factor (ECF subfamily)